MAVIWMQEQSYSQLPLREEQDQMGTSYKTRKKFWLVFRKKLLTVRKVQFINLKGWDFNWENEDYGLKVESFIAGMKD